MGWFRKRFGRRGAVAHDPDAVAEVIVDNVALHERLDDESLTRLVQIALELIDTKTWESSSGSKLTDEMRITVAANAAIPVLGLDTHYYRQVKSIVVHPRVRRHRQRRSGPTRGTVADGDIHVAGLAAPHSGPVTVAWSTARVDSLRPERGRNVVIHEFAHKIDMSDGYTDGLPPVDPDGLRDWAEMVDREFEAGPRADEVLRPYAWSNRAELFAVATETFFCTPDLLVAGRPELYRCLRDFYEQDPAATM